MIEKMSNQKVSVQRGQDKEPWTGTCVFEAFLPIVDQKTGKEIGRGPSVGICVQDERGFQLFAQKHQMKDAG